MELLDKTGSQQSGVSCVCMLTGKWRSVTEILVVVT